jgi:hypothetical protein
MNPEQIETAFKKQTPITLAKNVQQIRMSTFKIPLLQGDPSELAGLSLRITPNVCQKLVKGLSDGWKTHE